MAPDQQVAPPVENRADQPNPTPLPQLKNIDAIHLPTGVVSTGDARRLRRDLAALEEMLQAVRLRTNAPVAKLPRLSRSLEEFASTNRLNFLLPDDRHHAAVFMDTVIKKAPVLHISFASEATRKFTTELVLWLRANFDSEMLIEIGLEPNIAAGSMVRTANKVFDFSLMKHLEGQRAMLMDRLLNTNNVVPVEQPTVQTPGVAA
jgi:hypothetical protein